MSALFAHWQRALTTPISDEARLEIFHKAAHDIGLHIGNEIDRPSAVDKLIEMATAHRCFGKGEQEIERIIADGFQRAEQGAPDLDDPYGGLDPESCKAADEEAKKRRAKPGGAAPQPPERRKPEPPTILNATELNTMRFDPIKYVVPDIIVEGLTLLAAKPKMGKSWMVLHAAIAVARGGFTLGNAHCIEGDALYCALEDNFRRLQSRMTKLLGISQPWPQRFSVLCEMPRLAEGGINTIKDWILTAKHPRLVIIDTLAMVRAPKKRDQTNYEADYEAVKDLRAFAAEHGVAIVLVHQLRKQDADDAFDTVNATLGLTGAVDTVLVIRRDIHGSYVLHGKGRDLPEIEKAMAFNTETCVWTIVGDADFVRLSGERRKILAAMREIGTAASPKQIANLADLKVDNVTKMLTRMANDGIVERCGHGKYAATQIRSVA